MGKNAKWSTSTVTLTPRQLRGQAAERTAHSYLTQRGLQMLTRNYLCAAGEIDLIMRDGDDLVFVEVRYRKSSLFGGSAETVTPAKQRKLIKAALDYLQHHKLNVHTTPCRFDVVAILSQPTGRMEVEWIKDAFQE